MKWALRELSLIASRLWTTVRSLRSRRPKTSSTTPRVSAPKNSWDKSSTDAAPATATRHEHLRALEKLGEQYYDAMYDTRYPAGEYANAKDAFRDAVALARELGETDIEKRLEARLAHIKAVYRSQFT